MSEVTIETQEEIEETLPNLVGRVVCSKFIGKHITANAKGELRYSWRKDSYNSVAHPAETGFFEWRKESVEAITIETHVDQRTGEEREEIVIHLR